MFFILSNENKDLINNILSENHCICLYHWNLCGYCQMLMPTWDRLCKKYSGKKNVIIINIEQANLPLLKTKYKKNINGYPTIIKYNKGKRIEEFADKRQYKQLDEFITKKQLKGK